MGSGFSGWMTGAHTRQANKPADPRTGRRSLGVTGRALPYVEHLGVQLPVRNGETEAHRWERICPSHTAGQRQSWTPPTCLAPCPESPLHLLATPRHHLAGQRFERKATAKCLLTNESLECRPSACGQDPPPSPPPARAGAVRCVGTASQPFLRRAEFTAFPPEVWERPVPSEALCQHRDPCSSASKGGADGRQGRHRASPRPRGGNERNWEEMAAAAEGLLSPGRFHFATRF